MFKINNNPTSICLSKVNHGKTRAICEICSESTIKSPKRRQWRCSTVVSLLLTLNRFHLLFCGFHCWLWTSKYRLGDPIVLWIEVIQTIRQNNRHINLFYLPFFDVFRGYRNRALGKDGFISLNMQLPDFSYTYNFIYTQVSRIDVFI